MTYNPNSFRCHGPGFEPKPMPCDETPKYTAWDAWGNQIPMCLKHYHLYVKWLKSTEIARGYMPRANPVVPVPIDVPIGVQPIPTKPLTPFIPYTPGPTIPIPEPITPPHYPWIMKPSTPTEKLMTIGDDIEKGVSFSEETEAWDQR